MYKPKESLRWRPKITTPLRLQTFCLTAVADLLLKTSDRTSRNTREKKSVREFLSQNIPESVQQQVLQHTVERLSGIQTSLNLMDLFQPGHVIRERLDLLGPFRMGFGSYEKDGRLTWSQGSAKKFNLNDKQLEQLYNFLIWSKTFRIEEIAISISRDVLKASKIPNILARARALTHVTILSGAENHTLRILGINCPCLRYLDVSHSVRVTDMGLQSLLSKKLPRRKSSPGSLIQAGTLISASSAGVRLNSSLRVDEGVETNPCAASLVCITLLGTSVTWDGCESACRMLNFGYLHSFLPIVKIVRIARDCLRHQGVSISESAADVPPLEDLRRQVSFYANHALPLDDLSDVVMDHYRPWRFERLEKISDDDRSLIFLRKADSFMLALHMKINSQIVTALVLPWYTFTWRLDNIMDLDSIGTHFPNLKFLRARVKGTWRFQQEKLLPFLEEAYIWSLNSSTGLSILEHAPGLKYLEFNDTQTLSLIMDEEEITDETLEDSLYKNESLAETLEEFTIRPAELSLASLYFLVDHCPNIRRIGDLESWDITPEEIGEFNRHLDEMGSQCVLTVMNFPPSSRDKTEFI